VSLIEQAAKRLEELRRSGVELPDALVEPRPEERGRPSGHTPDVQAHVTPISERVAGPAAGAAAFGAPKRDESRPSGHARSSRILEIDLEHLAATGYVTPDEPHSPLANEFRVIKRPLLANAKGKGAAPVKDGNLIMVTSSVAGEGKSFTSVNLAISIAMELDSTVLLVDADVGAPSLAQKLKLPETKGLLDVLTDERVGVADALYRTNVEKLSFLGAGTRQKKATELLASDAMRRLVEELATRYPDRIIIFDSPPLLLATESRALASHVGQIVLVVEAEQTTAGTVKQALSMIETCPVVLTLLNKAMRPEGSSYYGYGGYGYGSRSGT
jgi:protein-tyrosine kinase